MREVGEVQEGLAFGFNAVNRVAVGVAWGGENRDGAVKDLVAIFMEDQTRLEDVEGITDALDHPLDVVGAVRLREVGLLAAPEIHFGLQDVECRVREEDASLAGEAADMVDVRVAEERVGDLLRLDAHFRRGHRLGEPAPRVAFDRAEAGVDEDDFLILTQEEDVDVERDVVGAFAAIDKRLGHRCGFILREHLLRHAVLEGAVAVADGPGLELADGELVDVGIGDLLARQGLRFGLHSIGGGERGREAEGGERGAEATEVAEEVTAGVFGEGLFHRVMRGDKV